MQNYTVTTINRNIFNYSHKNKIENSHSIFFSNPYKIFICVVYVDVDTRLMASL